MAVDFHCRKNEDKMEVLMARRTEKTKSANSTRLLLILLFLLVIAFVWSLGVGLVVLVAYAFALLMSIAEGKKPASRIDVTKTRDRGRYNRFG